MFKILKDNLPMYLVWLVMLACISVGVATTNILSIAALIIFAVFLVLSPTINSCVLLFGIMPFANIFKYQADATSFFTICELLLVVVSIFKTRKIKGKFIISLLLLATYMFATDVPNTNVFGIIKILVGFYLIYLLTSNATKNDVINIGYMLSGSTILMLLLSMNQAYYRYVEPYLVDLNYVLDSTGHATDIMRMGGISGDPNYCGLLVLMSVALLCTLYYFKRIKIEFWFFISFLIPLGFFTYSKSYFLCIAALVVFLILFVLLPKHTGWGILSIVAVVVIVSMATSGKIEVINVILDRFLNEDFSTGRAELNNIYLNYIWDTPFTLFFGEGISAYKFEGISKTVHNIYIEALFKFGVFGVAIYLVTLFNSISFTKTKKIKKKIANYFPLMFIAISYFALAGITMYEFPFYLAIAILAINFNSLCEKEPKYVVS